MSDSYSSKCKEIKESFRNAQALLGILKAGMLQMEENDKIVSPGPSSVSSKPTMILPTHMGAEPSPSDIITLLGVEFVEPSFGPPRGGFWANDDILDYFITYVIDPGHFYVQDANQQEQLAELEGLMTEWYNKFWAETEKPPMEATEVMPGGFYAVYLEDEGWYREVIRDPDARCRVEEVLPTWKAKDGTVKAWKVSVQLLDYGTRTIVGPKNIYPLRPTYLKDRTMACRASIDDPESREEGDQRKWSAEEIKKFMDKFGGKVVHGLRVAGKELETEAFQQVQLIIAVKETGSNDGTKNQCGLKKNEKLDEVKARAESELKDSAGKDQ